MLVLCPQLRNTFVTGVPTILQRQELHGEMDTIKVTARDRQVPRKLSAAGEYDCIKLGQQLLGIDFLCLAVARTQWCLADEVVGTHFHTLSLQLRHATVDQALFHLEVGNAITQQAADAIILFEQHHLVPGTRQLLGDGQPRGARTHDSNTLAGFFNGRLRQDPAFLPRLVDDGVLNRLDADCIGVDAQGAGFFARSRADAPGEFGEVVRRMQRLDRTLPVLAENEVVEIRDDVVDRATTHAEGNAAIHAARALHLGFVITEVCDKLAVVLLAIVGRFRHFLQSLVFEKSRYLAHVVLISSKSCLGIELSRRLATGLGEFTESTAVFAGEHLDEPGAI